MPSRLSFEGQREGGIARNVDALDGIHLYRNGERHRNRGLQLSRRFNACSANVASLEW